MKIDGFLPFILAVLVGGALHPGELRAAPGDLDLSFNGTGKVVTSVTDGHDYPASVLVQDDGKIIVSGTSFASKAFSLVRYNADGTLDTTFNGTGKVITGTNADGGGSAALQKDGRIVVVGTDYINATVGDDFSIARFNSDGTLDTTFGGTGKVATNVGSSKTYDFAGGVALQSDGRIVAAGRSISVDAVFALHADFAVVRYNPDGSLDTTFNGTGIVTTDLGGDDESGGSVVIQNDGKIVVAGTSGAPGSDFVVLRYNRDGSLDTSFGGTGKVTTNLGGNERGGSVVLTVDGKIVVAGGSGSPGDVALERFK